MKPLKGIASLLKLFAALPIGEDKYLGDEFLIRYTPSCQVLEFCKQRGEVEGTLSYGTVEDATDDLPCASFEGEQIAQLYNIPESQRLRGSRQATFKNYRHLLQEKKIQILHSCHHAESRLDNPLESVLKLADGDITLGQLMTPAWRLPDLSDVFLSCCETGLGLTLITDDILTLSTGFLCAGARSVISSLWSVHDLPTALFSTFYYQSRKEGCDRPKALWQAQIKLRTLTGAEFATRYKPPLDAMLEMKIKECAFPGNRYEIRKLKQSLEILRQEPFPFSHPFYWAAFTCQGLR